MTALLPRPDVVHLAPLGGPIATSVLTSPVQDTERKPLSNTRQTAVASEHEPGRIGARLDGRIGLGPDEQFAKLVDAHWRVRQDRCIERGRIDMHYNSRSTNRDAIPAPSTPTSRTLIRLDRFHRRAFATRRCRDGATCLYADDFIERIGQPLLPRLDRIQLLGSCRPIWMVSSISLVANSVEHTPDLGAPHTRERHAHADASVIG